MTAASLGPGTVLVVDDDATNRLLLRRAIERHGLDVVTAEDGAAALDRLAEDGDVDLVLLDILMPGIDGYEVLARLQTDPVLRDLPVLVVSGLDQMDSVIRCIELGADDFLPKPHDPALLQARIGAGLTRKRLRDLEREYLEQVERVVDAAQALEHGTFERIQLDSVAGRDDALGHLARVFQQMAAEIIERQRRLQAEVGHLRIEIDRARTAARVEAITSTDYFLDLERRAGELRRRADDTRVDSDERSGSP